MKIKFIQGLAGPDYSYSPGNIDDVEEKQAIRLCEAGIARPVKEKEVETATKPKPETAEKEYPVHTGGGWYELSTGDKIQGKEEAIEAQKELEGADN